jgi:hypothetical protein
MDHFLPCMPNQKFLSQFPSFPHSVMQCSPTGHIWSPSFCMPAIIKASGNALLVIHLCLSSVHEKIRDHKCALCEYTCSITARCVCSIENSNKKSSLPNPLPKDYPLPLPFPLPNRLSLPLPLPNGSEKTTPANAQNQVMKTSSFRCYVLN